ncbi:MAG: hypothetical protein Fur0035_19780 [Anaerolineales bacterium]
MKNFRRILPGLLISLALVAVILYFVDLKKVWLAMQRADYRLLLLGVALSVLWLLVRALVWRTLLRQKAAYGAVFMSMNEGYLLNNFLPFRLGEVGRAFLLSRKSELKFAEILPTIVIERVTDLAFTAAIFLAAIPFVVNAGGAAQAAIFVGAAVVVGLGGLYWLARNQQWALNLFHRFSLRWPVLQRAGGSLLEAFLSGLGILTEGGLFLRFLALMTLDWGIAIVQYTLFVMAFYPQATLTWGMFGLGAAAFGGAIPSLPGGVGTLEGALGGSLTLLSGDADTALAVALTWRALNYLMTGLLGFYALSREGQTIGAIYREVMKVSNQ